jgi:predicted transcriptional regulator
VLQKELYVLTEAYLKESSVAKNDFRKVLDAEIKYKIQFKEVMNKKNKILDYELQQSKLQAQFDKLNDEIDEKIEDLRQDSDRVFKGIVQAMSKFYAGLKDDSQ